MPVCRLPATHLQHLVALNLLVLELLRPFLAPLLGGRGKEDAARTGEDPESGGDGFLRRHLGEDHPRLAPGMPRAVAARAADLRLVQLQARVPALALRADYRRVVRVVVAPGALDRLHTLTGFTIPVPLQGPQTSILRTRPRPPQVSHARTRLDWSMEAHASSWVICLGSVFPSGNVTVNSGTRLRSEEHT